MSRKPQQAKDLDPRFHLTNHLNNGLYNYKLTACGRALYTVEKDSRMLAWENPVDYIQWPHAMNVVTSLTIAEFWFLSGKKSCF